MAQTTPISGTRRERLPNGYMRTHILSALQILCAAGVDDLVRALPKHMRTPKAKAHLRSALYTLVHQREVLKVMPDVFCLARSAPTWRHMFIYAKSPIKHILDFASNWQHRSRIEQYCGAHGMSPKKVGDTLRWLKARELVVKSGRSDWCVTRKLDKFIDGHDLRR